MLELQAVTLACIDTANHALALRALEKSRAGIRFARSLFLTDRLPDGMSASTGIELVPISPIASRDAYSQFVLKALAPYIATSHVLLVQWDGYVVNPEAWDATFLDCDYLGAKWYWAEEGRRVGNGGFSLRSRRLLDALADPRIVLTDNEDVTIGQAFRPLLEREHGVVFGSEAQADRFSFEAAHPIGRPFGFHGLFNFCRVMPEPELAALAAQFSDAIARSLQIGQLARNCLALGQWRAAAAIAQRMLDAQPGDPHIAALLAQAHQGLERQPAAGRNDPCPCGSGKRYKHCHGALAGASSPTANVASNVAQNSAAAPSIASTQASAASLASRGVAFHQQGNLDAAESQYRAALALDAAQPLALHYLGVVEYQRGRLDDALDKLARAVALVPEEPEFHNNLGLALAAADRDEEAISEYRRALELRPDHATAWNNLGLALTKTHDLDGSIAAYREALRRVPDFSQAHWNLSLALLTRRDYAEGWREYEWRLRTPELARTANVAAGPRFEGGDPKGKTLLLVAEQGLGDSLMFVRFASTLVERGARVVVQAPEALASLMECASGVSASALHDRDLAYDAWLPMGSIPNALGLGARDIPRNGAYLAMEPGAIESVRRDTATSPGVLRVGIAWAGNPAHANDKRRSGALANLAPLFSIPGVAWFSLQHGAPQQEIDALPAASVLTRLPDDSSFAQSAARLASLDLVITVDTSIAHLAGALGKPVWIMLPHAAEWRYGLAGERCEWYWSARLFRQPRPRDWASVVAAIGAALAQERPT
jgi:tetratricopeptide (TPR) repeat protein